jgi:polyisoprenoid-binding protein YceI
MRRVSIASLLAVLVASPAVAAEETYVLDPGGSDIHWQVYRAGAFARFGHSHVIAARDVSGRVVVDTEALARSKFELEFPVMSLVVDDPALRSSLGEEFASVPSADDIAGTRSNMLGDDVLQADRYSTIRVTGVGPTGEGEHQTLAIKVELLGRSVDLTVPTTVALAGDSLDASGAFEIDHAALGLEPFSVMAGALQVAERITFSYRVRARRVAAQTE